MGFLRSDRFAELPWWLIVMIRLLSIRQLAVVEQIEIEFENGLNVLTGETGAGKSILIDAVALLLGERASADLVRHGADAAVVQAEVDAGGTSIIVRREISAQGRSRSFVDDNLVTTAGLRAALADAVQLHGQHEHQRLLSPLAQLELLDAYAELGAERDRAAVAHASWRSAADTLESTERDLADRASRLEHARFELAEIDRVSPKANEDTEREAERLVLVHADKLMRLSQEAYGSLYEDDDAVIPRLRTVFRKVGELASIDPRFGEVSEQQQGLEAQLGEIARFLRSYLSGRETGSEGLQAVEDRLAAIERLKRRFGPTLGDVLQRQVSLRDRIAALEGGADALDGARRRCREAGENYLAAANELSGKRRRAAPKLCRALEQELSHLAFGSARCEFAWRQVSADESSWTSRGIDAGELLLAANLGEAAKPLARVASGGELSRIMLACHMVGPTAPRTETLVFDEVDAGIGGQAADAVGARLRQLGQRHQVLCVTHLPQVAAYGDVQFRVSKVERAGRTVSSVSRLGSGERVDEIARMMAGNVSGASVRAGAQSLLESRQRPAGRKRK